MPRCAARVYYNCRLKGFFFANEFFVCQEEQHSGSSANYDVEIVHSSQVHLEQAVASKIARLPPYHNHV